MPRVLPFAGLRYATQTDELSRLICPPYDVIGPDDQAALRASSPSNAIHVELPADEAGQPGSRYPAAARRLDQWRAAGVVAADPQPSFYLSETEYTHAGQTRRRRDLLAAAGVEAWSSGAVLPHEHTMAGPKADRLELLRATHLNASPIWLLHRDPIPQLDVAWATADTTPPTVEFTWRSERHRLWVVDDMRTTAEIQAGFAAGKPLYIADGHHRYETSLAFKAEAEATVPGAGAILAAVTWADEPGLLVLPTHRIVAGLDPSLTLEQTASRWSDAFHVEHYPFAVDASDADIDALIQRVAHSTPTFGIYGLGQLDRFGVLSLRGRTPAVGLLPAERSDAWKSLDVSLLHALLVDPLVAATGRPPETVLSYTRDPREAVAAVRAGQASVALFLNPTPVRDVLAVADAHDRMPEKSTYFHPKPPAGVVLRDLDRTP